MIKQLSYVAGIVSVAGLLSACSTHHHYACNEPSGASPCAAAVPACEPSGAEATASTEATGNEVAIPLYEERVNVGKQEVPSQVQVRKFTTTETVSVPVELRHEHVVLERAPAGAAGNCADAFKDKSVTIQLQNEQPVVNKQTVQTGQVIARKDSDTQKINVQSQVRKEDVQVDRNGNPNVDVRGNINEASGAQPK